MSRNPRIEQILEAWFELEHCDFSERSKAEAALNQLLDSVVADSDGQFTREQILDHLFTQYKEFRSARRKELRLQISQASVKRT
jgi:hypothetical protein